MYAVKTALTWTDEPGAGAGTEPGPPPRRRRRARRRLGPGAAAAGSRGLHDLTDLGVRTNARARRLPPGGAVLRLLPDLCEQRVH